MVTIAVFRKSSKGYSMKRILDENGINSYLSKRLTKDLRNSKIKLSVSEKDLAETVKLIYS